MAGRKSGGRPTSKDVYEAAEEALERAKRKYFASEKGKKARRKASLKWQKLNLEKAREYNRRAYEKRKAKKGG